jgi:hypothetical protein
MSSTSNKQFNFRELRVTGVQVWSTISGRSLINNLNRLWLRLSPLGAMVFFKKNNILIPNVAEKNILILMEGKK